LAAKAIDPACHPFKYHRDTPDPFGRVRFAIVGERETWLISFDFINASTVFRYRRVADIYVDVFGNL